MNFKKNLAFFVFIFGALNCLLPGHMQSQTFSTRPDVDRASIDSVLTNIQKQTFQYFWDGAEPISGMARERINMNGIYPDNDKTIITIGGSGFGILSMIVAMERGFISREEGVNRFLKIFQYLNKIDRFKGAYSHWYDGESGKTKAFSERDDGGDIVETAFLAQALIVLREYFITGSDIEKSIAKNADDIWRGIDWNHYTNGDKVLYWHWSPKYQFIMKHPIRGFDECMITYILAASSPSHPIDTSVYHQGWARSGGIRSSATKYGLPLLVKHNANDGEIGPLFWQHYSFLALNPHGLQDRYASYWDVAVNHAKINLKYADANPKRFKGYGKNKGWGLTASYSIEGYQVHHPDNDLGVISPTAALSSIPYTPDESISFSNYLFNNLKDKLWGKYGFYDAYSESDNWFPQKYLAIDQGPIIVMIENYRSGLIWNLFMGADEIKTGLKKLDFKSIRDY